jgi:hypothetical protein
MINALGLFERARDSFPIGASSVIELFKARARVKFHALRPVLSQTVGEQSWGANEYRSCQEPTIWCAGLPGTPSNCVIFRLSPNNPAVLRRPEGTGFAQNAFTIARAVRLQIVCRLTVFNFHEASPR